MSKDAAGELRRSEDGFVARITIQGRERKSFLLSSCRAEVEAEARMRLLASLARQFRRSHVADSREASQLLETAACCAEGLLQGVIQVAGELCGGELVDTGTASALTFEELAKAWTSGALHKRFPDNIKAKDSELDEARIKTLCAIDVGGITFGALPVDQLTLAHARAAMGKLPALARRPATRRQYALLINRVMNLAVYPCEEIKTSPLPRGFVPGAGKPPKYPYLYPSEDAALMAECSVPLVARFLYGFLVREGMRTGEALALQFRDLDLARGTVSIDENKTDDPRTWALDPGVVRALASWKEIRKAGGDDHVFPDVDLANGDRLAEALRRHLKAAGVDRRDLHHIGTNTRPMRAHDLRGTFVTLSLASGKTETWVADRTGHKSSAMINRYRRAARSATELLLGKPEPLNKAIPELCVGQSLPLDCPRDVNHNAKDAPQPHVIIRKPKWRNWQTQRIQNPPR